MSESWKAQNDTSDSSSNHNPDFASSIDSTDSDHNLDEFKSRLTEEQRDLIEERVGIMQHDGGLDEKVAEKQAMREILDDKGEDDD
jgi:hypothetical protein